MNKNTIIGAAPASPAPAHVPPAEKPGYVAEVKAFFEKPTPVIKVPVWQTVLGALVAGTGGYYLLRSKKRK